MRYFSTHRPLSIGAYPRSADVIGITNYDKREFVSEINAYAYGHIDYTNNLTQDEQDHYDLRPAIVRDEKLETIIRTLRRYESDEGRFTRTWDKAKARYGYTDEQLADAYDKSYATDTANDGLALGRLNQRHLQS